MSRKPTTIADVLTRAEEIVAPARRTVETLDAEVWGRLAEQGWRGAELVLEAVLHKTTGVASRDEEDRNNRLFTTFLHDKANAEFWGAMMNAKNHLGGFDLEPSCVKEALRDLEDKALPAARRLCGVPKRPKKVVTLRAMDDIPEWVGRISDQFLRGDVLRALFRRAFAVARGAERRKKGRELLAAADAIIARVKKRPKMKRAMSLVERADEMYWEARVLCEPHRRSKGARK
jgi:hypothetical protein